MRHSVESHDHDIAKKARDRYKVLTENLEKDIKRAIRDGMVRNVNSDLVSFGLLDMAEGLGHKLMMDSSYTPEDAVDVLIDFLQRTLLRDTQKLSNVNGAYAWVVKRLEGNSDLTLGHSVQWESAIIWNCW